MKVSTICTAMPLPVRRGKSFYDTLAHLPQIHQANIFVPLSPMVKRADDVPAPYAHRSTIRGVSDIPLYPYSNMTQQQQQQQPASMEELLKMLLRGSNARQHAATSSRHALGNKTLADQESHSEVRSIWQSFRFSFCELTNANLCHIAHQMWSSYVNQVRTFKSASDVVSQGLPVPDSFPMRTLSPNLSEDGIL